MNTNFPALRCQMGEWIYYLTFFKFSDVDFWIKRTDQIHRSDQLREMIQRSLTNNVESIAEYLVRQNEHFFNSIVVGVYGGAPQWFPIEINTSPVLGDPDLNDSQKKSIGILQFEGEESLFAIDGQHRVEGIKKAINQDPSLKDDELSVILLAHEKTEEGQRRTRRLFTTLNKWAKPVTPADIIALDEDDAFAIITRRLVEDFTLLESETRHDTRFVNFGPQPSLHRNNNRDLTTIRTLYQISSTIYLPVLPKSPHRSRKAAIKDRKIRPSEEVLDEIFQENVAYWNHLAHYLPEYRELFSSLPGDEVAGKYRTDGGHFMFRPLGQQAFASAVRVMMDRDISMQSAVQDLVKVPMQLNQRPWLYIIWDPRKERIIRNFGSRNLEGILLYLVGQKPRPSIHRLLQRYRTYVGDDDATLPNPVAGTLV